MGEPDFWNNQERAKEVVGQVKSLKVWVDPYDRLTSRAQGALEMDAMLEADPDPDMIAEVARESASIHEETEAFSLKSLDRKSVV